MSVAAKTAEPTAPSAPFDALIPSREYRARDFSYYEDWLRRWTAVSVFGAIYLAMAGLEVAWAGSTFGTMGVGYLGLAVLLFVVVTPVLYTFVSGETAFAAILAAFTVGGVGFTIIANWNASPLATLLYFSVLGGATFVAGVTMSLVARRALRESGDL